MKFLINRIKSKDQKKCMKKIQIEQIKIVFKKQKKKNKN